MYDYFKGELVDLLPTTAVVEVGGIGHIFSIPLSTYDRLKRDGGGGTHVRLNVHLYLREDEMRLYGFATHEERRLFRMVLSVTGVGPSIALACLSALRPEEVLEALAGGECKTLQRVKGVGRRVAERMIVDLKERAGALIDERAEAAVRPPGRFPGGGPGNLGASDQEDAVKALVELGYQRKAAESLVASAVERFTAHDHHVGLEELIKSCLRQ